MKIKIVWLNGMPRSGTSWLGQIFDSHPDVRFRLAPIFSYEFKNVVDVNSNRNEWLRFFLEVYYSENSFMTQKDKRLEGIYPIFKNKLKNPSFLVIKHTRYHNLTKRILELIPEIKFIHIIRNPCATINSWLKATGEFPSNANPLVEWKTGSCRKSGPEEFWGFDDWKRVTSLYLNLQKHKPQKVFCVKYEDLVEEPVKYTQKMFRFVDLKMNQQTMAFLKDCHKNHQDNQYAVFKSKDVKDRWKEELDFNIVRQIRAELRGTQLEQFIAN